MSESYSQLQLSFIENRGQVDPRVAYYLQGRDTAVYFTAQGITLALTGADQGQPAVETLSDQFPFRPASFTAEPDHQRAPQRWALKLDFIGANPHVR